MKLLPPPGPARRRQLGLLTVVLVLLGGLSWYEFSPTAATAPTSNSQTKAMTPVGAVAIPAPVKLDALSAAPTNSEVGRNPFGFGVKPPPPEPVRTYTPPPVTSAPPPPVPQGPPPIALRLAGLTVIPGGGRTMATLRDPSGALFQAFEGDIVDGRYRIIRVGIQSVIVSYVDGTGQRTIPLG